MFIQRKYDLPAEDDYKRNVQPKLRNNMESVEIFSQEGILESPDEL